MELWKVILVSKLAGQAAPLVAAVAILVACAGGENAPIQLGPVDGLDLPPTELERVAVGSMAPDFSLEAMNDDTLTLSDFRGQKNVVLVFYRGHW